ncbi:MAG: MBL fold metallo-hydrolase, partial [Pseudomonadota bacterium]
MRRLMGGNNGAMAGGASGGGNGDARSDKGERRDDGLTRPYAAPPNDGVPLEVADGLWWVRLPLPFRLNHVNIWLIEEDDGFAAIDCGPDTPAVRAVWEELAEGALKGRALTRLIATHGHVDHVGLSGWVCERFGGIPYHASLAAWLWARHSYLNTKHPRSPAYATFLTQHGVPREKIDAFLADKPVATLYGPQPDQFVRLGDNGSIGIGARRWRIGPAVDGSE